MNVQVTERQRVNGGEAEQEEGISACRGTFVTLWNYWRTLGSFPFFSGDTVECELLNLVWHPKGLFQNKMSTKVIWA